MVQDFPVDSLKYTQFCPDPKPYLENKHSVLNIVCHSLGTLTLTSILGQVVIDLDRDLLNKKIGILNFIHSSFPFLDLPFDLYYQGYLFI